jgi:hypothetical protein
LPKTFPLGSSFNLSTSPSDHTHEPEPATGADFASASGAIAIARTNARHDKSGLTFDPTLLVMAPLLALTRQLNALVSPTESATR